MQTPNCFIKVDILDTSPLLNFSPPDLWHEFYLHNETNYPGRLGDGVSAHIFGSHDAKVFFSYPGISSEVMGGIRNCEVVYTVDQESFPNSSFTGSMTTWSAATGTQNVGVHSATLSMVPNTGHRMPFLSVSGVSVVVGLVAETTDPDHLGFACNPACNETLFADALDSSQQLLPSGNWLVRELGDGAPKDSAIVAKNKPEMKIFPPRGSNFFSLNGTVGDMNGQYSVAVSPPLPAVFARSQNTFNALTKWGRKAQLLYYTPLDPREQYTITVTGDPEVSRFLALQSWKVCGHAATNVGGGSGGGGGGGERKNEDVGGGGGGEGKDGGGGDGGGGGGEGGKANIGAVAGGIVGGVLGAALLGLVLFLVIRRKYRTSDEELFTVDDTIDATMTTPYDPPAPRRTESPPPSAHLSPQDKESTSMRESVVSGSKLAPPVTHGSSSALPSSSAPAPPSASGSASVSASGSAMRDVALVEHEDAGALPLPAPEPAPKPVEHLPPTYDPDWLAAPSSPASAPSTDPAAAPPPMMK